MRESDLLRLIRARSTDLGPGVVIGPGDDCAALKSSAGTLLLTVDQVIEGRHFVGPLGGRAGAAPLDLVARKAIARSVSDIAAMAGMPRWSLATAALPRGTSQAVADELFLAMARWAKHWGCPIVGGDIATLPDDSPRAVLTVTVGGEAHPARGPVTRSGAKPGDEVWVTGHIGGSLASGRHLTFEPRVAVARALADALGARLHAMIDLSDGLGRDVARMAEASGVAIEIDQGAVPLHGDAGGVDRAVRAGEDYELAFVVAPQADEPAACAVSGVPITRMGRVVAGSGCVLVDERGERRDTADLGWDH